MDFVLYRAHSLGFCCFYAIVSRVFFFLFSYCWYIVKLLTVIFLVTSHFIKLGLILFSYSWLFKIDIQITHKCFSNITPAFFFLSFISQDIQNVVKYQQLMQKSWILLDLSEIISSLSFFRMMLILVSDKYSAT